MLSTYKIETFEDLLKALKEKPEWLEELRRIILTEELIALPQRFHTFVEHEFKPLKQKVDKIEQDVAVLKEDVAILKEDVAVLKEDVAVLKEDVAVLKEDVAVLKEDVAVLKEDVAVLKEDVAVLKKDVAVLKEDVAVLKEDVAVLKKDVAVLKKDVAVLKEDVAVLKQDVAILKHEIKVLKDDVANLKGDNFERKVREKAPAYFGRLIKRCRTMSLEDLADYLEEAVEKGIITEEEKNSALNIDVVVTGFLKTDKDKRVVLAGEVSVKVDRIDVERAYERASVIGKALGLPAIAVVIGEEETEGALTRADELGVVLI
jgi:cell division protein FtsB